MSDDDLYEPPEEEELPSSSEDEEDRKRVDSDAEELEYRKKRLSVAESVAQEHKQARDAIVKVALDAFLLPQLTQIICSYNDNLQEAHLQIVCDFGKAIAQSESSEVCPFHLCKQLNLVAKTLGEDEEEDQSVVVVDYGSSVIKAGTSGEPFVTASFGSYLGRAGDSQHVVWVGSQRPNYDGLKSKAGNNYTYGMECKVVHNWKLTETFFQHCFSEMRKSPDDNNICLLEPPKSTYKDRETALRLLFGVAGAPGVSLVTHPVAALACTGRTVGLVIDFGHQLIEISPVDALTVIPGAIEQFDWDLQVRAFTERTVHDHFFALPDQLPEPQRREAFRAIFEKVCFVADGGGKPSEAKSAPAARPRAPQGAALNQWLMCEATAGGHTGLVGGDDCWLLPELMFKPARVPPRAMPARVAYRPMKAKPRKEETVAAWGEDSKRSGGAGAAGDQKRSGAGDSKSSESKDAGPPGLLALIARAVAKCPAELHAQLWGNVVICGGGSLLRGLPERLRNELPKLSGGHSVQVIDLPYRAQLALLGAQFLSALPTYEPRWVYANEAFKLIEERCPLPRC